MGQYDNQLLQPLNTDRGGLSGIEKGINAYFSERDKRLKREQDEKEYKMGLKLKGLIETEDGGVDYDPYTEQMRNAELEQKQYELPRMKQQDQLGLIKANAVDNDGVISEDALALKRRELENQKLQSEIANNYRVKSAGGSGAMSKDPTQRTFEQRLSSLPSTEKGRYDNVLMGTKALDSMESALAGDANTFSVIGDNPYTFALNQWNEAIGRMQSGGAINDEEAKRFKAMAPGALDSEKVKRLNLNQKNQD